MRNAVYFRHSSLSGTDQNASFTSSVEKYMLPSNEAIVSWTEGKVYSSPSMFLFNCLKSMANLTPPPGLGMSTTAELWLEVDGSITSLASWSFVISRSASRSPFAIGLILALHSAPGLTSNEHSVVPPGTCFGRGSHSTWCLIINLLSLSNISAVSAFSPFMALSMLMPFKCGYRAHNSSVVLSASRVLSSARLASAVSFALKIALAFAIGVALAIGISFLRMMGMSEPLKTLQA